MNKQPLYIIIYEDGEIIKGGMDYFNTGWLELPFKKIKRVFYKLPSGDFLTLSDYDSYFHMVEGLKDWMKIGGKEKIKKLYEEIKLQYAYIMGKKNNTIISYRITLNNSKDDRYKKQDITVREFNLEDKFIKGLNNQNWR